MRTELVRFGLVSILGLAAVLATASAAVPQHSGEERSGALDVPESRAVRLEGIVLATDGSPASGALVVSSAGGKAVADDHGRFALETSVPLEAESVQVTAFDATAGGLAATARVQPGAWGSTWVGQLSLAQGGACSPSWLPTFGLALTNVNAIAVHDDGSGPALYVAGSATPSRAEVARWDGSSWSDVVGGGYPFFSVHALCVYDDGSGPALYAGGVGTLGIKKWDGASWSTVGYGLSDDISSQGSVYALAVHDDGTGPALYAGGLFSESGAADPSNVARWDGTTWSALGAGTNGTVRELAVFDDGSGPALYAGGEFTTAGGVAASHVAKWDGTSWTPLGSGTDGWVRAFATFDDGSGPSLYAGGSFTSAGGQAANRIAKWDGASWSALGAGCDGTVFALLVHDDGGGQALYAGGSFTSAGGAPANRLAEWDGASWTALEQGVDDSVFALALYDDGGGPALYAGGSFVSAEGESLGRIGKWDGTSWTELDARKMGVNGPVSALATFDDGSGEALYVGGFFTSAGDSVVRYVAKWDCGTWSTLGGGLTGPAGARVTALAVHDDGSGPALYVGGMFTWADGSPAHNVARWDGTAWAALGTGMEGFGADVVRSLAVYDDGGGPALYAGGDFEMAGGVLVNHVAKWDGSTWTALGGGVTNPSVTAMAVYDDGTGPALYVGGGFVSAGGVPGTQYLARWNGASWSAVGAPPDSPPSALAVHGSALYAGGSFTAIGGNAASGVARWDGTTWWSLGLGVGGSVRALAVHDDGRGPALYAGGGFTVAGGVAANSIARWDGTDWAPLGSGVSGPVLALAVHEHGGRPALFAGGNFLCPDSEDAHLAQWNCPEDEEPPTLECPPFVSVREVPSTPLGEAVTFSVTARDCQDPAPTVVCVPPSGSVFPLGTTLVTCTATDAAGNETSCQFPVTVLRKVLPR